MDTPNDRPADRKIADMPGVQELSEGYPVELWLYKGRVVIRCLNEAGYNHTNLELDSLANWLSSGRAEGPVTCHERSAANRESAG